MRAFKLLFFFIGLFAISFAQAQNFHYKNQVWAYPDCSTQSNIRIWADNGRGGLALNVLTEKGLMTNEVKSLNQSGNKTLFSYGNSNASEAFEFTSKAAQTIDRTVNGNILIKDGIVLATNQPTSKYQACDKNSTAGQTIFSKMPLIETKTASLDKSRDSSPASPNQSSPQKQPLPSNSAPLKYAQLVMCTDKYGAGNDQPMAESLMQIYLDQGADIFSRAITSGQFPMFCSAQYSDLPSGAIEKKNPVLVGQRGNTKGFIVKVSSNTTLGVIGK
jgi:hypothetical protein